MTSAVDTTFPADDVKVSKATFRAQMLIISQELSALQARTGVAGIKAFYNFVEHQDLVTAIKNELAIRATSSLAKDIAFGRVSLN